MSIIVTVIVSLILLAVLCATCYVFGCEAGYRHAVKIHNIVNAYDNEC